LKPEVESDEVAVVICSIKAEFSPHFAILTPVK